MEQSKRQRIVSKIRIGRGTLLAIIFMLFQVLLSFGQPTPTLLISDLPTEKIYLHLDKTYFNAGEDIWFKAYLVDGITNRPSTLSEILYVELIDSEKSIIDTKTIKTIKGSASGEFQVPPQSQSGGYILRAYTNYMRNFGEPMFFIKPILVNSSRSSEGLTALLEAKEIPEARPDVQFFPEGGYMVNGLINPIAFKAIDTSGKGIEVSGQLLDDTGRTLKSFASTHLGMGLFHFIPTEGRSYRAIITSNDQEWAYDLPTAQNSGVLMTVSNHDESYKIELRATSSATISGFTLLGKQQRSAVLEVAVNDTNKENTAVIRLTKDILKEGITQLTLLNADDQPIAERLLFHENENKREIANIAAKKGTYGIREQVALEIDMHPSFDIKNTSVDLSLAVTNTAVGTIPSKYTDIKTYLLLHSELQGIIEQPGYYFHSNDLERKKNLDLLMRTQGWRQYRLNDAVIQNGGFLPETGISIMGKVISTSKPKEPLTGTVFLTSNNIKEMAQQSLKTDSTGNFKFENLDLVDTTGILLSARVAYANETKKRKAALDYKIVMQTPTPPKIAIPLSEFYTVQNFILDKREAQNLSNAFLENTGETIVLDEAIVSETTEKEDYVSPKEKNYLRKTEMALYREPSQTIHFDDVIAMPNLNPLQALQGRVAGLSVRGDYVYLRGMNSLAPLSNPAMVLLDGMPIDPEDFFIRPQDIDFVDILKGNSAAIFGARGGNGVVAIYTKDGLEPSSKAKRSGALNFDHPGYHYAKAFYEPKYAVLQTDNKKVDARTTLHWQPYVQLTDKGRAVVSFYTGDVSGDYNVSLEGITSDGRPISTTTKFKVDTDL